jgi:hypothetical protein
MNDGGSVQWIERSDLLTLARRDVDIAGDESPEAVLTREPYLLVAVSEPSVPALDPSTYRVRLERWERGDGLRLTGMREFVQALETVTTPTRAAVVSGEATTYTFLLDESMSEILACVAIDKPTTSRALD